MASPRVYLDHNATAPLRPQARTAALEALAFAANPSSVHAEGRRARALVEDAGGRSRAWRDRGPSGWCSPPAPPKRRISRSRPTRSPTAGRGFDRLLVGATEHAAVLHGHRFGGEAVETVPVLPTGVIDLAALVVCARPRRSLHRGGPGCQQRDRRSPADRRSRGTGVEARRRRGLRCRSGGGADCLRRRSGGLPPPLGP